MKSDFYNRISENHLNLTNSEIYLIEYIKDNLHIAKNLGIKEMSKITNISIATISRLSKKLGYTNFQEMRTDLSICYLEQDNSYFDKIKSNSSTTSIINEITHNNIKMIEDTFELVEFNNFELSIDILEKSKYCGLFGIGGSSVVCQNIYHRFLRTSLAILYSPDYHLQLMNATKLNENDCAIIVSYSGLNKDSIRTMNILKNNGVKTILITSNIYSPMYGMADIVLSTRSKSSRFNTETFSSMVAHITISDCLFALYSLKVDKDDEIMHKIRSTINSTRGIDNKDKDKDKDNFLLY